MKSATTIIWDDGLMPTKARHLLRKERLVMHHNLFCMMWLLILWAKDIGDKKIIRHMGVSIGPGGELLERER